MAQPLDWTGRAALGRALVLTLCLALAACGGGPRRVAGTPQTGQAAPKPAPTAPVPSAVPAPTVTGKIPGATTTVGLLVPLTGPNAALGRALSQAGQLALFDTGDQTTALVVRDSEGSGGPVGAAQSAMQEGATILLGPVFSADAKQVGPAAATAHVPVVSFTTDKTVAGPGLFVMGILPGLQIDREVQYAAGQGFKTYAALLPSIPYGQIVAQALNQAVAKAGGKVVAIEYYDPAALDYAPAVQKLSDEGPYDALLIPYGGNQLHTIAPLLAAYKIDTTKVKILGSALWTDPSLANESTLVGAWFAAPPAGGWATFAQNYHAAYGEDPPPLASLAYDAVAMTTTLAKAHQLDQAGITRPEGFTGINGPFRFLPNGLVERNLDIMEVQPTGIIVKDPAPQTFPPPQG
jgi:ABC-type branched-subunit amino acid transport system substrate-binding protein